MPHKPLAASDEYYTPDTPGDLYADVIRELDGSVGTIRRALESAGILKRTIFIFMSDNGPHYGGSTGGLKGKKATAWEGGVRVPFIVRYPAEFPRRASGLHAPLVARRLSDAAGPGWNRAPGRRQFTTGRISPRS